MSKKQKRMTIPYLIDRSHVTAVEHGWWAESTDWNILSKLALVHSEVSEALEAFRDDTSPRGSEGWWGTIDGKPEGLGAELADVLIRIFDLCGWLDIDLGSALAAKLDYNDTRPYRHGGKLA